MCLLAAAACAGPPDARGLAAPAPAFEPLQFFAGRTSGEGAVSVLLSSPQRLRVAGEGWLMPDGSLLVEQRIEREGQQPRRRSWRIRRLGQGRYAGTMSDAQGPVRIEASGNSLHISYADKDGLAVEQRLFLQPDGRTALNRMSLRKFGITVARVSETIRRVD